MNLPCDIIPTYNFDLNVSIPASLYIKCNSFYYQILILVPRGNFYWVPRDDFVPTDVSKLLGDYNRAFEK